MKAFCIILSIVFSSITLCFSQAIKEKPYVENTVIIKIRPAYKSTFHSTHEFQNLSSLYGASVIEPMFPFADVPNEKLNSYGAEMVDVSSIYSMQIDSDFSVEQAVLAFGKLEMVEYAEPLYKLELLYVPDDPMNLTDQYWLENIKAFDAWDINQGDTNIVIGISDTGTDLAHSDIIYNIKNNYGDLPDGIDNDLDGFVDNFRGWDFAENDNNAQVDGNSHGVWVSGIAGASTDNGIGVSGAGFKCKILPLKIINEEGLLENSYQSIVYAADHGVDVLNCSWGGEYYQRMAQEVVDYAVINHDMLIVSAAGNTDSKSDYYPSSYNNVLSVAGTTALDERWSPDNSPTAPNGSSYSYFVDVSAPATMFKSTDNGSGYTLMWGGTSFSAPIVSGCAGILRSAYPDFNANQIAELIKISADLIDTIPYNIPYTGMMGAGRMNLYNALTMELTPSVCFQDFTTEDYHVEGNNGWLTMNTEFTNWLAPANGLTIRVSTDSEYASVNSSVLYSGDLGILGSYNSVDQILVNYLDETPRDYKLKLDFEYEAGEYYATQTVEININPAYINISTQKLEMSVTSSGRLGFTDASSTIGDGFIFDEYFPLFYDCGIISGISASEIFSGVRQVSDFATIDYPVIISDSEVSDNQIDLSIDDSDDIASRDIEILESVYTWNSEEYKNFIILDYWIINNGLYDIEDFYFGLFADWDLVEAANNSIDLIEENNFMYCYNSGAQSMYSGFKVLTEHEVNNYGLAQISGGDGVVDITDGFADIEKFYMISNTVIPEETVSSDMIQFTGAGPFDIVVDDTVRVGIAIIASDNIYDLEQAVSLAQITYNEIVHPSNINISEKEKFSVYPNPASFHIYISLPDNLQNACVLKITNVLGSIVYASEIESNIELNVDFLPNGLYNFELVGNGRRYQNNIIISR